LQETQGTFKIVTPKSQVKGTLLLQVFSVDLDIDVSLSHVSSPAETEFHFHSRVPSRAFKTGWE